ncbi:MAG: ParB N-terminal domain-containing protein [Bryobacterales bacterium]|nr:ParB N-terminal domain-containing protein [Bryobacterales bacterium]
MKAHPAAELFPMMTEAELRQLAEDIKAHGLADPITMLDGMILDGRNRFEACKRAGVDLRYEHPQDIESPPALNSLSRRVETLYRVGG